MSAPRFTVEPSRTPGNYLVFQDGALLMVTNNADLARVIETHEDVCAALKECEWAGVRYGADACPICDVYSGWDHLTGCALAAALAKARGEG